MNRVCLGPSLDYRKSQFCHAAAKRCCGSGYILICYIYHVEFHFRFRHLLSFPVKHQLWRGCHGEKSSKKISGNFLRHNVFGNSFVLTSIKGIHVMDPGGSIWWILLDQHGVLMYPPHDGSFWIHLADSDGSK